MAQRSKRSDELVDRDRLLAMLRLCLHDLATAMSKMHINGPLYAATAELLSSIDAVALVLTNRPDIFHAHPHGTRPPQP
jgi:hypothetical protein